MKNSTGINRFSFMTGFAVLFVILTISGSCSKSDNNDMTSNPTTTGGGTPPANEVFIQGMSFVPNVITVAAGTTIKWTNKDAISHTVTSNTALFDSGSLAPGKTFTYTFAAAGTYSYYCVIHPTMVASVTVN